MTVVVHAPRVLTVTWVVYKKRSSIKLYWRGQGSPKFQYNARGSLATQELREKYEKNMGKTEKQLFEKKTACDKRDSGETATVLLAVAYQKLGCSQRNYHAHRRIRHPEFSRAIVSAAEGA